MIASKDMVVNMKIIFCDREFDVMGFSSLHSDIQDKGTG